ncbi:hypothetical protein LB504_003214 [Fusarium proliferatum]|nr:hypothetical protein LB504_003214 [Fusarium proliferatum]
MPGGHGFLLMLAHSAEFNPCIWFRALTHKKRYIDDEVDPIKHSLDRSPGKKLGRQNLPPSGGGQSWLEITPEYANLVAQ